MLEAIMTGIMAMVNDPIFLMACGPALIFAWINKVKRKRGIGAWQAVKDIFQGWRIALPAQIGIVAFWKGIFSLI